ncbi:methyltransferase [Actinocatenispora comari]|uniref:Methyltransferase n=1 Tax=Actinocatenispora comari TaxID=2807577 RepID=A0A8J4AI35_9ACTN|nr:methyltransferase [Actinocatenispora comari]
MSRRPGVGRVLSRIVTTIPTSAGAGDRHGTFAPARSEWLESRDHVRNLVRQEMIGRQLDRHLPAAPQRVLDVGAGQGTQSIRLARAGHQVLAVEPDGEMRAAFTAALAAEPAAVRDRVILADGAVGRLEPVVHDRRFDAVLLLGVLMYLPASEPVLAELAARVAPGGFLAIAARTATSAVWRPAARQDWLAAAEALAEYDAARAEGRDLRYVNEIGSQARADTVETLVGQAATAGLELEQWYGVRVAVDLAELDPAPPTDPAQWQALLAVEERLGAVDPYRQLAQLAHLILRRPPT